MHVLCIYIIILLEIKAKYAVPGAQGAAPRSALFRLAGPLLDGSAGFGVDQRIAGRRR